MDYAQKVASITLALREATEDVRPTLIAGIRVSIIGRLAPLIARCTRAERIRQPDFAGWQLMDNDDAVGFFLDSAFFPSRAPFVFAPTSPLEIDALKLLVACVRFEERRQLPDGSHLPNASWKDYKRAHRATGGERRDSAAP